MATPAELRVFAHLTAERAPLYRAVLGAFVRAKERFAVHLRPADVEPTAAARASEAGGVSPVASALAQLVEWGNLEAHPDTADVATVKDFYRPRYLYQLTPAGEAAERALTLFETELRRPGELQTVALADIRVLLEELAALAAAAPLDEGKAHRALREIRSRFEELAAQAQAFMASLQRTIDLHGMAIEALVSYKETLIGYLERFIGELLLATADISALLARLDPARLRPLLAAAAARELADRLDAGAAEHAAALEAWEARWTGLRSWFISREGAPSESEVLRQRARSAIPALLAAVASRNERRLARSDRAADLRTLARWFAEAKGDREAHRLWRAAFALSPARHLSVDDAALAARDADPVPAQASWLAAPPLEISPRLRRSGRWTRRGPAAQVVDRDEGKAYLARLAAEEAALEDAARRRLATGLATRLSEIGALDRVELDLLLDLVGAALAAQSGPGTVTATSTDGALAIVLEPPSPPASEARLETADGVLTAPDFRVTVSDAFTAREPAPAPDLRPDLVP